MLAALDAFFWRNTFELWQKKRKTQVRTRKIFLYLRVNTKKVLKESINEHKNEKRKRKL